MKKIKKLLAVLLAMCLSLACFALVACGDEENGEKAVKSIKVTTAPSKVEYNVGDTIDFSDGVITVTYEDGSTETKKFTDEGVEISEVNTEINDADEDSMDKTVTVRYGGKRATFTITVSHAKCVVTFDYGYTGATASTTDVRKNEKVEKPTDPTRDGHTFDNWYSDSTLTMPYDFGASVTDNTTVYAKWLENGATYLDVTFDYNYAGSNNPAPQKVKSGEKATKLAVDPTRKSYSFDGWFADAAGTTEFSFDGAITAATTVYAKWTRTSFTVEEYVFEAEDTDLSGKTGPGFSGSAPGVAMIQTSTTLGASNDRFIGYQYKRGCSLEFRIVSDMAVTDAKIVLRLSAEMRDYLMSADNYKVMVNGSSLDYKPIEFKNVPVDTSAGSDIKALPFEDFVIAENVKLKEGNNNIVLQTENDHAMEGTTMVADAPLIDCLKITTSAVLTWSAKHGLPKKDNY